MSSLQEQARDSKPCNIDDMLPLLETISQMFPQYVLQTCVSRHSGFRFVSHNCNRVFGYSAEGLLSSNYQHMLFSHIHPEDIDDLRKCFLYLEQYLNKADEHSHSNLRLIFTYRLWHGDGYYVRVTDQKAALNVLANQRLYYCLLKSSGRSSFFDGTKLEIYDQGERMVLLDTCHPSRENFQLSRRESDILQLLQEGMSNKEIAYQLDISPNTARNIRQKMFNRYGVNNTIELLNRVSVGVYPLAG